MSVERTFWEKATLAHVYCCQGKMPDSQNPYSRHWHDLTQLDVKGHADHALADRELAKAVAMHKTMFFSVAGVDYDAAVSTSLRLVPEAEPFEVLKDDYARMVGSGLLAPGDDCSFDEMMSRCRELEKRANR